jgi:hypothetical protein
MTTHLDAPFLARRARLLTGMTPSEFADMFGVGDASVSQWECGKLRPPAKAWPRIREIAQGPATPYSSDGARTPQVFRYVVWINNLTRPAVLSTSLAEVLAKAGVRPTDLTGVWWAKFAHSSPDYGISCGRALEIIEADKGWLSGAIAYAEAHAFSVLLRTWLHLMVAPLPDRSSALIEAVEAASEEEGGFWVRLVHVGDVAPSLPGKHTPSRIKSTQPS